MVLTLVTIGDYGDDDDNGGVENNGDDNVYLITGKTLERKIQLLPSALPRLSLLIIFIIVFVVVIVVSSSVSTSVFCSLSTSFLWSPSSSLWPLSFCYRGHHHCLSSSPSLFSLSSLPVLSLSPSKSFSFFIIALFI